MDLLSSLFGPAGTMATPGTSTVQVTGTGTLMATPTEATVTVGVRNIRPTAVEAQSATAEALARIAQAIQGLGVPAQRLQTTAVQLFPETRTDTSTNEVRTVGFRAEQTLTVTTPNLALVGPIIDAAVANGANLIESISFSVPEPTQLQLLAIAQASQDAQLRSLILASQFGLRLTGVRRVSTAAPGPIPLRIGLQFAPAAPVPIFPGQVTIQATVDVEYTAVPGMM